MSSVIEPEEFQAGAWRGRRTIRGKAKVIKGGDN